MGYCVEADVKKRGGSYMNSSMPVTVAFDFSRAIETVSDEIDSKLFKAGVEVPVDTTTFTIAKRRLRDLCVLGVLAIQEDALGVRASAGGNEKETASNRYQKLYRDALAGYTSWPQSLFAGESSTTGAWNGNAPVKPKGDAFWSYNDENDVEPEFEVEDEF